MMKNMMIATLIFSVSACANSGHKGADQVNDLHSNIQKVQDSINNSSQAAGNTAGSLHELHHAITGK